MSKTQLSHETLRFERPITKKSAYFVKIAYSSKHVKHTDILSNVTGNCNTCISQPNGYAGLHCHRPHSFQWGTYVFWF